MYTFENEGRNPDCLERTCAVFKIKAKRSKTRMSKYPFADQGRRLRLLRQAERIPSGLAFAMKIGWGQSAYSQFETGMRRVTMDKALQLRKAIPGFDPLWLWEGDKTGLSFDLRRRIEEEEVKESGANGPSKPGMAKE